jgi:hypothetical protein
VCALRADPANQAANEGAARKRRQKASASQTNVMIWKSQRSIAKKPRASL